MIFNRKKPTQSVPRLSWLDKLKLLRLLKDDTMLTKLKSRKLWVTVLTTALLTLSQQLGLDPELTTKIVAMAASYVLGQSIVDAKA